MAKKGVNDATLRENLRDIVRHLKNGVYLSCMADSAYGQAIIWASERIAELEIQSQSPETGSDENPADSDLHGDGRSEIDQLQNLLGQVYDQCGNHRAADRRHCLSPGLRDEIQGYLQAAGHQCAIAQQENKGNDMTDCDAQEKAKKENFGDFVADIKNGVKSTFSGLPLYGESVIWASKRIAELEITNKRLAGLLYGPPVESVPQTPQECDEEIHQRRRRERLLDEVTLICVRDRIEQLINAGTEHLEPGATTETRWGRNSRDTADNICRGINEYDAEQ